LLNNGDEATVRGVVTRIIRQKSFFIQQGDFGINVFGYEGTEVVEVGDFEDVGIPKKPTSIDKDLMEEVRLSQLMIDDPFGFEREVLQAEQRRVVDEAVQN